MPVRILPPAVGDLEIDLGMPEGTLTYEDAARAQQCLERATAFALALVPAKKAAWIANCPEDVYFIVLGAARRQWENPQGVTQESIGDRSVSGMGSTGARLTQNEAADIRRAARGTAGFVGSIYTPSGYAYPFKP